MITDLAGYDGKHVIIRDIFGVTFTGLAQYGSSDFLECEYKSLDNLYLTKYNMAKDIAKDLRQLCGEYIYGKRV